MGGVEVMVGGSTKTPFTIEYIQGAGSAKVGGGGVFDTLNLLESDESIDVRLYVDNTFTEVYFQGGRVAMTINTPATDAVDVDATATVWSVSSIWVTPEDVMRTPRLDGKP